MLPHATILIPLSRKPRCRAWAILALRALTAKNELSSHFDFAFATRGGDRGGILLGVAA
jgi:hypothetical protein